MEKRCSKCKEVKPITEFSKKKSNPDGYQSTCKPCSAIYDKQYHSQNHEKHLIRCKKWREVNRESQLVKSKEYRQSHKTIMAEYWKEYSKNHKERHKKYRREHSLPSQQWRYTTDARAWVKSVYTRDNYTCQHCGKTHCQVHAHHIKPAKDFEDLRYDLDNGICLCAECHKKEHSILMT